MFAKVQVRGTIEVVTGMHIGGSSAFAAIGAVDSPVIKDTRSGTPIIPGSSLKGKMRSLLAKQYNTAVAATPDDDDEKLTRLFGCAKKGHVKTSRVLFYDMVMNNWEELKKMGLTSKTEVKFENTIKRTTAVANPRQIERVVRGAEFPIDMVYEVSDEKQMIDDFKILKDGFILLQYDYLGGSGSRGYGKINVKDMQLETVIGEVDEQIINECETLLQSI